MSHRYGIEWMGLLTLFSTSHISRLHVTLNSLHFGGWSSQMSLLDFKVSYMVLKKVSCCFLQQGWFKCTRLQVKSSMLCFPINNWCGGYHPKLSHSQRARCEGSLRWGHGQADCVHRLAAKRLHYPGFTASGQHGQAITFAHICIPAMI